jgi:hypothetical protein
MINTINIDKDIMLYSIVDALGGGQINWRKREVSLLNDFLGKRDWIIQELITAFITNGRDVMYRR